MTQRRFIDAETAHVGWVQDPSWIRDMQSRFAKTGQYRGHDVRRVLGDPRDGISVNCLSSEAAANVTLPHKASESERNRR